LTGEIVPTKPLPKVEISKNLSDSLDERIAQIRTEILQRAQHIAAIAEESPSDSIPITIGSLASAIDQLVSGQAPIPERRPNFFDYFPPFTCVCAILCVIFAVLGLAPLLSTKVSGLQNSAQGFLDLAKIFAGAIVGSTSSIALGSAKKKGDT
jgi:hypothetical protein